MKKYFVHILFLVLSISVLSACNKSEISPTPTAPSDAIATPSESIMPTAIPNESTIPAEMSTFKFDEQSFKARYNAAMEENKSVTIPAPIDLSTGDFAVLQLSTEIYGIESFAILPLTIRDLTDDEMKQLAFGMGGISADDLLTPKYSRTGFEQNISPINNFEGSIQNNRYNKLRGLYLYNNMKEFRPLSTNYKQDGDPVVILIDPKTELVKIYPLKTMTDDQMLQIISVEFARYPQEVLQPKTEQIQYNQLSEIAEKVIKTHALTHYKLDRIDPFYIQYSYGNSGNFNMSDKWILNLHFEDGNDFALEIKADDGTVTSWVQHAKDYFSTEKEYIPLTPSNLAEKSTEEIVNAATEYVQTIWKDSKISSTMLNEAQNGRVSVSVSFENGSSCAVVMDSGDLSINALMVQ